MRRRRRITLAAAALAMAAGPALADYGASASLTGITFELVDLRPDDGIAPSANIVVGGWGVMSHIFGLKEPLRKAVASVLSEHPGHEAG